MAYSDREGSQRSSGTSPASSKTSLVGTVVGIVIVALVLLLFLVVFPFGVFVMAAGLIYSRWSAVRAYVARMAPFLGGMPSGCLVAVVAVTLIFGYGALQGFYEDTVARWVGPDMAESLWGIPRETEAHVTRVIDGDSFEVLVDGKHEIVKVPGIDAPDVAESVSETPECYGEEAKMAARQAFEGKAVTLIGRPTRDEYGRLRWGVKAKDMAGFNAYQHNMLINGLARVEIGNRGDQRWEVKAREQGLGMWSPSCQ